MNNDKIISDKMKWMWEHSYGKQDKPDNATFYEIECVVREALQESQKQKDDEIKENNCAWCPDCGDLLKIKQFKLNPNENWIYYCEGCDKEFEIVGRSY